LPAAPGNYPGLFFRNSPFDKSITTAIFLISYRVRESVPFSDQSLNLPKDKGEAQLSQNLLARVQLWTIILALALSAVLVFVISPEFALGVFLTALWAVAGLFALEKLLRSAVLPPGEPRNVFAIILWGLAKLAVYGIAAWVLFSRPFPTLSHAVGFTLMMVVLVVVGARARDVEIRRLKQQAAGRPTGQGDQVQNAVHDA